jgi:hypothetical protein
MKAAMFSCKYWHRLNKIKEGAVGIFVNGNTQMLGLKALLLLLETLKCCIYIGH